MAVISTSFYMRKNRTAIDAMVSKRRSFRRILPTSFSTYVAYYRFGCPAKRRSLLRMCMRGTGTDHFPKPLLTARRFVRGSYPFSHNACQFNLSIFDVLQTFETYNCPIIPFPD